MNLKEGTIKVLHKREEDNELFKQPVMQLLDAHKFSQKANKLRYKGFISDGAFKINCILSSDICAQIESGAIKNNDFLKLNTMTFLMKDTTTYVCISTLVGFESHDEKVGNPVDIHIAQKEEKKRPSLKPNSDNAKKQKMDESHILSIKNLTPFINSWTIRGRVVSKSDIRTFKNNKGDGKLFSFEFLDNTSQIKVVCFNNSVTTFYPLIQENKTFEISNGTVKMANKKFTQNNNDYEAQLDEGSKVVLVEDNTLPVYSFNFTPINEITLDKPSVDVCGIIKEVDELKSITTKSTGKEVSKRDLILLDKTGSIRLTLWGSKAEEEFVPDTVLCVKNVRTHEYIGVSVSASSQSQVYPNCEVEDAIDLLVWYNKEGKDVEVVMPKPVLRTQFIGDLINENAEYGNIQGTIMFVKEDSLFYSSCPTDGCNKKVVEEEGGYRCEKCNETYENCNYKYISSFSVSDSTGHFWVTAFDEAATQLFGASAKELNAMRETDPEEVSRIVKKADGEVFVMKVRIKDQMYNDQMTKRITCSGVVPVDKKVAISQMHKYIMSG